MVDFLQQYSDYFQLLNLITKTVREIGWGIIKGLAYLISQLSGMFTSVYNLLDIFSNSKIQTFIDQWSPVVKILLVVGIVIVGYALIFKSSDDNQNFKKVLTNILIVTLIITAITPLLNSMINITKAGVGMVTNGDDLNISGALIKSNIKDILWLDQYITTSGTGANKTYTYNEEMFSQGNDITERNILGININEIIDPQDPNITNDELYANKMTLDANGNTSTIEYDDGGLLGSLTEEGVARYSFSFFPMFIALLGIGVALIFVLIKIAMIIYELLISEILLLFIAPVDINNGERIKKIILNIVSSFAVLFFMAVLLKIFTVVVSSLNEIAIIQDSPLLKSIIIIALSYSLIQGPNIIQSVLGVDAGLSSGSQLLQSAYYASRMGGEIAQRTGAGLGLMNRAANGLANKFKNSNSFLNDQSSTNSITADNLNNNGGISESTDIQNSENISGLNTGGYNKNSSLYANENTSNSSEDISAKQTTESNNNLSSGSGNQTNTNLSTGANNNSTQSTATTGQLGAGLNPSSTLNTNLHKEFVPGKTTTNNLANSYAATKQQKTSGGTYKTKEDLQKGSPMRRKNDKEKK